jgi:hypothetical protein
MTYSKKLNPRSKSKQQNKMSNPNVLISTNGNGKRVFHNDQHWYTYHMKLLQNVNCNLKVKKFKHVGMTLQMYKYTSNAGPCKL